MSYPSKNKSIPESFKIVSVNHAIKQTMCSMRDHFIWKRMKNHTKVKKIDVFLKNQTITKIILSSQKNQAKNLKKIFLPEEGQHKNKLPHATVPTTTKVKKIFLIFFSDNHKKYCTPNTSCYQLNNTIPTLPSPPKYHHATIQMLPFQCCCSNAAVLTVASQQYHLDANIPRPSSWPYHTNATVTLASPCYHTRKSKNEENISDFFSKKSDNHMKREHRKN